MIPCNKKNCGKCDDLFPGVVQVGKDGVYHFRADADNSYFVVGDGVGQAWREWQKQFLNKATVNRIEPPVSGEKCLVTVKLRRHMAPKSNIEILDCQTVDLMYGWKLENDDGRYAGEWALIPNTPQAWELFDKAGISWIASGDVVFHGQEASTVRLKNVQIEPKDPAKNSLSDSRTEVSGTVEAYFDNTAVQAWLNNLPQPKPNLQRKLLCTLGWHDRVWQFEPYQHIGTCKHCNNVVKHDFI